jgi:hypothetical protein
MTSCADPDEGDETPPVPVIGAPQALSFVIRRTSPSIGLAQTNAVDMGYS